MTDLRDHLEPAYDEERTAAAWQRIVQARAGRPRRPWFAVGLAAAAATAAIALWLFVRPSAHAPGPLASREVSVEAGAVVEAPLVLDDGSHVDLVAPARLQVLANDGTQFVTLLDRGAAHFDVTPGGPRRWRIETALATVEVVGTAFRVDPSPHRLVVEVERGVVVVSGDRVPGRIVKLTAGERIEVTDDEMATNPPPPAPPPPPISETVPVPVPAPVPARPTPKPLPPSPPPPPAPPPAPAPPADDLERAVATLHAATAGHPPALTEALAAADRLRAANRPDDAADLLAAAIAASPDDPAAGLASFTLGRLALDNLHDYARAADAFARVIALGSPSSLLEDAYARRADALLRAGDRDAAATALDAYERAFPKGRRAAALRARLNP